MVFKDYIWQYIPLLWHTINQHPPRSMKAKVELALRTS
jgi:hypothetical protein